MTLDQQYDPTNIFAKIIHGEIPSYKIYEDEDILSFMDAFPQAHGHALVIPKKAMATNLLDIETTSLTKTILKAQDIARAMKSALSPAGIKLMQFNGAPAGQTVFHVHFHLIPVYDEGVLSAHATVAGDPETLTALAAQIGAAL